MTAVVYGIVKSDFNCWKTHWLRSEFTQEKVLVPSDTDIALFAGISFVTVLQITFPNEGINN